MRLRYRLAIQMLVYWLPMAIGVYLITASIGITVLLLIIAGVPLAWLYWWAIVRVRRDRKSRRDRLRRLREIRANPNQFWKKPPGARGPPA